MKAEYIEVTLPDTAVSDFLQETIHNQNCPEDVANHIGAAQGMDANDEPCLPGLRRSSAVFPAALKLARAFSKSLDARNIKAGALMHFSSESCPSKVFAAFLGVTVKKPCLQTLITARVEDSQASFQLDDASRLQVRTAQEIFSHMLQEASERGVPSKVFELAVEVWQWKPFLDQDGCLQVRVEDMQVQFHINCKTEANPNPTSTNSNLPFGMKMPRKERRKGRKGPGVLQKAKVPTKGGATSSSSLNNTGVQHHGLDAKGSAADAADSFDSQSGSESDDSTTSVLGNVDETEPVEPINETMRAEALSASAVEAEVASAAVQVAEAERAAGEIPRGSTFFTRKLGLGSEHGLAASGRSKCHVCHALIPKGDVRFQWWWHTKKPNAWLHPYCVIQAADNINLRTDTVSKLELVSRDFEVASVQAAASSILESLLA